MSISSAPKTYFHSSLEYFKNLIVPLLTSQWVRASREDLVEACSGQLDPLTIVARGLLRPPGCLRTRETMAAANGFTWPRQLIIDFGTKPLACHAGGGGFAARRSRQDFDGLVFPRACEDGAR